MLNAQPASDSEFIAWTPASCVNPFTLNATTTCQARFELKSEVLSVPVPIMYQLTLKTSGVGAGEITGTTAGRYAKNTLIQLNALPDAASNLEGWTPTSCSPNFQLTADTVCTAQFELKPVALNNAPILPVKYSLNLQTTGTGKGQITGTVAGEYTEGSMIQLMAVPENNAHFVAWTPASCGNAFSLTKEMSCSAQFDINTVILAHQTGVILDPNPCIHNVVLNMICNAAGEKTQIKTIEPNGQLSNTRIESSIINQGWISDSTLTAKGRIIGGTLTGFIENQGIIRDVDFKGRYLNGGILSGKITNSSTVGAYFENVSFTANSYLRGGILQGMI